MAPLLPEGVRAVLLDALGTLLALAPPGPALAQVLRERHGLRLEVADAERAFAAEIAYYRAHHQDGRDAATLADLRARCAEVLGGALPPAVGRALNPAQLTEAMLGALRFAPFPDVPDALRALRARGLRLVVVSNWDLSLPVVLGDGGLAGLLDGVVTSAAIGAEKPDPEIFRAALRLAGVPARQALHVGDSPALDVAGAHAAGIAAVLLRRDVAGAGEGAIAPAGLG
ncbi:MAG TPA: HAD-IA family hydrolase, partial [Solirubrobacteraceae bacterium]|nr:HAD-IA family hydrolase [Solirubrobacteraceae bacterium]